MQDKNAILEQLRVIFEEQIKEHHGDAQAHASMLAQVCRAAFFKLDTMEIALDKILPLVVQEITKRPFLLIHDTLIARTHVIPIGMLLMAGLLLALSDTHVGLNQRQQVQNATVVILTELSTVMVTREGVSLAHEMADQLVSLAQLLQDRQADSSSNTVHFPLFVQRTGQHASTSDPFTSLVPGLDPDTLVLTAPSKQDQLTLRTSILVILAKAAVLPQSFLAARTPSIMDQLLDICQMRTGTHKGKSLASTSLFAMLADLARSITETTGSHVATKVYQSLVHGAIVVLSQHDAEDVAVDMDLVLRMLQDVLQQTRSPTHRLHAALSAACTSVPRPLVEALVVVLTETANVSDVVQLSILSLLALPIDCDQGGHACLYHLVDTLDQARIYDMLYDTTTLAPTALLRQLSPLAQQAYTSTSGSTHDTLTGTTSRKRKRDAGEDDPSLTRCNLSRLLSILAEQRLEHVTFSPNDPLEQIVTKCIHSVLDHPPTWSTDDPSTKLFNMFYAIPCARSGTLRDCTLSRQAFFCAMCDEDDHAGSRPEPSMGDACLKAFANLSRKIAVKAEPKLYASLLSAMARFIKHCRPGCAMMRIEQKNTLFTWLRDELSSRYRLVRSASGICLAELVRACSNVTVAVTSNAQVMDLTKQKDLNLALQKLELYARPEQVDTPHLRRTAIECLGRLGLYASDEHLGNILRILIVQLGRHSDPLSAMAHVQLFNMAKHRNTSPYKLVAPFLPLVSRHIFEKCSQRSTLVVESLSSLIGISPAIFAKQNAATILPVLVLQRRLDAIHQLAAACDMETPILIVHRAANIISFLYLQDAADCQRGLEFMFSLFSYEGGLHAILSTCTADVLFELCVQWGDLEEIVSMTAENALERLERDTTSSTTSKYTHEVKLNRFLGDHSLGVLSLMNDHLNDVHGKKSVLEKVKILRGLEKMMTKVGPSIATVSPQIMATLQSCLPVPGLHTATLEAWRAFIKCLKFADVGPFVAQTSAAFACLWNTFSPQDQTVARKILDYLVKNKDLQTHLYEMASLSHMSNMHSLQDALKQIKSSQNATQQLLHILSRVQSENQSVCLCGLVDLNDTLLADPALVHNMASGDAFDPLVGKMMKALVSAAIRAGEAWSDVRDQAFQVIGVLGALDPDRCELPIDEEAFVVQHNFKDVNESIDFALHLIVSVLAGAYRASNDTTHQGGLAFCIQELLRFCGFSFAATPDSHVTRKTNQTSNHDKGKMSDWPKPLKARWAKLPDHIVATIMPLLEPHFNLVHPGASARSALPVFSHVSSYRDWVKTWTLELIARVTDDDAKPIFESFLSVVKLGDIGVARKILPHLVLHVIISPDRSTPSNAELVRREILAVLEDQLGQQTSRFTSESRLLCAQLVFDVMDHISRWVRKVSASEAKRRQVLRRQTNQKAVESSNTATRALEAVKQLLDQIPQDLQAEASLQCKAYARSLLNFEKRLMSFPSDASGDSQKYYEHLHYIYAQLDEPDGMEGISSLITAPSIAHQIREHESMGHWTEAQSCWELLLEKNQQNVDSHVGLLKCLGNLGHYDSMRTQISGLLLAHPEWSQALAPFQVEAAFIAHDWDALSSILGSLGNIESMQEPSIVFGYALNALGTGTKQQIDAALKTARHYLGAPILAAGQESYRRVYDAVLRLHVLHEAQVIHSERQLESLPELLGKRLTLTSPAFKVRETVLNMRRASYGLWHKHRHGASTSADMEHVMTATRDLWLNTAKASRKAGHMSTSYTAILHAMHLAAPLAFFESSKLARVTHANGVTQALRIIDQGLKERLPDKGQLSVMNDNDVPQDVALSKVVLKKARWMIEAKKHQDDIVATFLESIELAQSWETPAFYLGRYYDERYKQSRKSSSDPQALLNEFTLLFAQHAQKNFFKALSLGSKYIYQALPRALTVYLELGSVKSLVTYTNRQKRKNEMDPGPALREFHHGFATMTKSIRRVAQLKLPAWQWLTVFPQVVSRILHPNKDVAKVLDTIMLRMMCEFPHHAFWGMISVAKSTVIQRSQRCMDIIDRVRSADVAKDYSKTKTDYAHVLFINGRRLVDELLKLANYPTSNKDAVLQIDDKFRTLLTCMPCRLIIPLQSSLNVSLPAGNTADAATPTEHRPFALDLPTFESIDNDVELMQSLIKPKKITVNATDGNTYSFLCKPKDDLRKDARLMEFNSVINKLLKRDSESRKRHLHIRTYAVVPMNEECGMVEWVPNTVGFRHIVNRLYEARGLSTYNSEIRAIYDTLRSPPDPKKQNDTIAHRFKTQILVKFPPVFHQWFLESFPEPSTWLRNRMAYARTIAVMSMVGFVLGLGDRHGENILFDTMTGDACHVDFNCLFDKGRTFDVPELVPFRLTQNIVDGFGVMGVEGIFRRACEVTMRILRANTDSLMSVLETFVHDPLVEWSSSSRGKKKVNAADGPDDPQTKEARKALQPILQKLSGLQIRSNPTAAQDQLASVEHQVDSLIQEATDLQKLGSMYIGWSAYL